MTVTQATKAGVGGHRLLVSPLEAVNRRYFLIATHALTALLVGTVIYNYYYSPDLPRQHLLGFAFIAAAAVLPVYLWIRQKATSIPIFPAASLPLIVTHALPLLTAQYALHYDPDMVLGCARDIAGAVIVGALVWHVVVQLPSRPPASVWVLPVERGSLYFLGGLFVSVLINLVTLHNDETPNSILVAIQVQGALVCAFSLAYSWGVGKLSRNHTVWFLGLLLVNIGCHISHILLVDAMFLILATTVGYALGSASLPVIPLIIVTLVFGFLHVGKTRLREMYWAGNVSASEQQGLEFAEAWISASVDALTTPTQGAKRATTVSRPDRTDYIYITLLVASKTPQSIPYFDGESYSYIPDMLTFRFLNPDKPDFLVSDRALSWRYGLITSKTDPTSIGWDIFGEAEANYGTVGCYVVMGLVGLFYGLLGRWCLYAPVNSFRFIVAAVAAVHSILPHTTVTLVSDVFQVTAGLLALAPFVMQRVALSALPDARRLDVKPAGHETAMSVGYSGA